MQSSLGPRARPAFELGIKPGFALINQISGPLSSTKRGQTVGGRPQPRSSRATQKEAEGSEGGVKETNCEAAAAMIQENSGVAGGFRAIETRIGSVQMVAGQLLVCRRLVPPPMSSLCWVEDSKSRTQVPLP